LTWEREDLLARYAEVMIAGTKPKVGPVAADPEVEKMRLELERQKLEFEMRQAEADRIERERQAELEKQKLEFEAQKADDEKVEKKNKLRLTKKRKNKMYLKGKSWSLKDMRRKSSWNLRNRGLSWRK